MAGAGTGYPIWFRCPQERVDDNRTFIVGFRGGATTRKHRKVRTGRTKPAPSPGKGNPRKLDQSHEYVCSCGHKGWTCHIDVLQHPLQGDYR